MKDKEILQMASSTYSLYQLAPSVIHEFNNIFTAIISTTQFMIEYEDNMELMITGFKEIQKYTEKAVSFNRFISTYLFDKNERKITISECFKEIEGTLNKELLSNNTNLNIEINENTKNLTINKSFIKVAIQLILNAQDESSKTDINLLVYLKDNNLIIDTISDFPEIKNTEQIFELGYTDKKNRLVNDRYKRKHFGIGLAMSRYLVNLLNGKLDYVYENNKSIFRTEIPINDKE